MPHNLAPVQIDVSRLGPDSGLALPALPGTTPAMYGTQLPSLQAPPPGTVALLPSADAVLGPWDGAARQGGEALASLALPFDGKLYVGGLDASMEEDSVSALMETVGPLRALYLAREGGATDGPTRGFAFAAFADAALAESAIGALSGRVIGERKLVVLRATHALRLDDNGQPLELAAAPLGPTVAVSLCYVPLLHSVRILLTKV